MENTEFMLYKTCFKCGDLKLISDFYKHQKMKDGHLNKCKDCTKEDSSKNRWSNIDEKREHDRSRGSRQSYEYCKAWREKHPNKYKAEQAVNNAIRDGKIDRPKQCEVCMTTYKVVAHHDDYSKPLSVRWLCQACHMQWHRDNGEGLNG